MTIDNSDEHRYGDMDTWPYSAHRCRSRLLAENAALREELAGRARPARYDPDFTPIDGAHVFIQWNGTDVCLDFYCECGAHRLTKEQRSQIASHAQTLRTVIEENAETYTPERMVIFLTSLSKDFDAILSLAAPEPPHVHEFGDWDTHVWIANDGKWRERRFCDCGEYQLRSLSWSAIVEPVSAPEPPSRECRTNHGRVEMLAKIDHETVGAVGTDFPLSWSPICRDCGADVPAAGGIRLGEETK